MTSSGLRRPWLLVCLSAISVKEDFKMEEPAMKYRKYDMATFIIMASGLILFMLTPLLIRWFGFDSDVFGLLIFLIGFVLCLAGIIVRFIMRKVGSRRQSQ